LTEFEANMAGLTDADRHAAVEQQLRRVELMLQAASGTGTSNGNAPHATAAEAPAPSPALSLNLPPQEELWPTQIEPAGPSASTAAATPGPTSLGQLQTSQAVEAIQHEPAARAAEVHLTQAAAPAGADTISASEQDQSLEDIAMQDHIPQDQEQQQQQQQQLVGGGEGHDEDLHGLEELSEFWSEAVHMPDEEARHKAVQEHIHGVEHR
jgi:hypothetical protein